MDLASGTHSIHYAYPESLDTPQVVNRQLFWACIIPSVTWTFPDRRIVVNPCLV